MGSYRCLQNFHQSLKRRHLLGNLCIHGTVMLKLVLEWCWRCDWIEVAQDGILCFFFYEPLGSLGKVRNYLISQAVMSPPCRWLSWVCCGLSVYTDHCTSLYMTCKRLLSLFTIFHHPQHCFPNWLWNILLHSWCIHPSPNILVLILYVVAVTLLILLCDLVRTF